MKIEAKGDINSFEVDLFVGDLDPNSVRVELYADGVNGTVPLRQEMKEMSSLPGTASRQKYGLDLPKTRPAGDYTARAIPCFAGADVPLEAWQILWQR
jgi:starch phosphorylase